MSHRVGRLEENLRVDASRHEGSLSPSGRGEDDPEVPSPIAAVEC